MDKFSIIVGYTESPSLEDIKVLAKSIIADLPSGLNKYIGKLKVDVIDFPDLYIEQELELETPFDILGYYESAGPVSMGHLSSSTDNRDGLYLFRRPILDIWCDTGENLTELVNRIILQEIGTHFGFTEDEVEMYEDEMKTSLRLDLTN